MGASEQEVLAQAQAFHAQAAAARTISPAASGPVPNIPDAWRQRFQQSDASLNLPPGTTERQIGAKSTFNPNAVNSSGARGLAQIMPGTQPDVEKAIGRSINPFNPFDAMDGHDFVMRRAMNSRQGNIVQSLLDYGGFRKDNRYSDSARDYLTKILGEHWIMYDHPESPVPR